MNDVTEFFVFVFDGCLDPCVLPLSAVWWVTEDFYSFSVDWSFAFKFLGMEAQCTMSSLSPLEKWLTDSQAGYDVHITV